MKPSVFNLSLKFEDFLDLFKDSSENLPKDFKILIRKYNFKYRFLTKNERDQVILDILKNCYDNKLSISGKKRISAWEKGWEENLKNFIKNQHKIEALTPGYYRASNIKRLKREYIKTDSSTFEFDFFRVFRHWAFNRYLSKANEIFEFACGSGHNLPAMAQLFPKKSFHGLDWTLSSKKIVDLIAEKYGWQMKGHLFNMFEPNYSLHIPNNSVFVTIGGLEQLGKEYESFLEFIFNKKPSYCLHIEPIYEFYDTSNLLDYLGSLYHKQRKYLSGFLTRIKKAEESGQATIIDCKRIYFGAQFHEGWNILFWSPK